MCCILGLYMLFIPASEFKHLFGSSVCLVQDLTLYVSTVASVGLVMALMPVGSTIGPLATIVGPLAAKVLEVFPESFRELQIKGVAGAAVEGIESITDLLHERQALNIAMASITSSAAFATQTISGGHEITPANLNGNDIRSAPGEAHDRSGQRIVLQRVRFWERSCGVLVSGTILGGGFYVALKSDASQSR